MVTTTKSASLKYRARAPLAYRVEVQVRLVVRPVGGQAIEGGRVFGVCQVEMRKGGDDRGT